MKTLKDRVVVVTGGGSGIGRSLAWAFAREGSRIVLVDIEAQALGQTAAELAAAGHDVLALTADVSNESEVREIADAALERFGAVHVLCNNAGVESGGDFEEISVATWRWVLDVNLWGVILGCRTFLPILREQDEAHIVNTGSLASFNAREPLTFAPYAVSKAGVLAVSEALDAELRAGNETVGVSILAPGFVKTRMPDSERNRPTDVPPSGTRPGRRADVMAAVRGGNSAAAIEPDVAAAMVVEAVKADRFFVLTHPDAALNPVRDRLDLMLRSMG